ncbi:hypothetical protein ACFRCI_36120 [Streptomyces sp. NPDC056638]|uniref:hypothetical protein n=1 Tax=Streptomyces sp. NPDC056638 TaxID=3345887 RepID=UPI0036B7973C
MSSDVRLTSVETDSARVVLTVERLGTDPLIAFVAADADTWLGTYNRPPLALACVDCRPGKFHRPDDLLDLMDPAVSTSLTTCSHHPHGPRTTSPASICSSRTCPIKSTCLNSHDMRVRGAHRNPHLTGYRERHVCP